MRDFSRTPEPRGRKVTARKRDLRYYIQRHAARRLHYDFRLELEGVLKSWAVPKGPSLDPADRRLAMQTEDHPLEYGEFEGVIPEKQYGAGEVLLWDKGVWIPDDPNPVAALRKGRLNFHLDGEKLRGGFLLTRMRGNEDKPAWLLIKRHDEAARSGDITEERPESVKKPPKKTRKSAKSELPQFVAPQLATLVTEPPKSGDWIYEAKHDGYRILAKVTGGEARLFTRSGKDWTDKAPAVARALEKLKLKDAWLDGELVALLPDGRSSFQALQNAFEAGAKANLVYFVFDAPYLEGKDLMRLPLRTRKERLKKALHGASGVVRFSEHLAAPARQALEEACKLGLEGLIGKLADSVYVAGRTRNWIKLKCRQRQEFVIAGYTPPQGSRQGFGALVVGVHDAAGKLRFAGKVGTGYNDERLRTLTRRLASLKRPDSPLEGVPRDVARETQWVRPVLVAEVAFAERTNDGILRQASFLGLREDKPAKSVGVEKAEPPPQAASAASSQGNVVQGVKISHPDRLVWPSDGITKLDLVRYYDEVIEWFLPHVADRPLTMVRCPDGAEAQCFYQRHLGMGASPGDVLTLKRERSSKGYYIYVNTHRAVITLIQNGAVELHTWGAKVADAKHPDRITMDLDPGPDLPWEELKRAAEMTKAVLDGLKLASFLKTTGGKGLHVVVPIKPELEWDRVKEFSRLIAVFLTRAEPSLFTAKIAKERRTGKVFVDYLRNAETASAVAAFSARARPGAAVSTPLAWDELDEDLRTHYTVKNLPKRLASLKSDPWAGYARTKQSITPAMWRALDAE